VTTWERDDKVICPSSRYSKKEDEDVRVLEILNVTEADAGVYRITLENHTGRVVANVRLDVVGKIQRETSTVLKLVTNLKTKIISRAVSRGRKNACLELIPCRWGKERKSQGRQPRRGIIKRHSNCRLCLSL